MTGSWFKHILLYQYTKGLGMATLRHKPSPDILILNKLNQAFPGDCTASRDVSEISRYRVSLVRRVLWIGHDMCCHLATNTMRHSHLRQELWDCEQAPPPPQLSWPPP